MKPCDRITPLAARILISVIFLLSGITKVTGWSATASYMASKGMPMANVLLAGAVIVEIVGGLSLLFGYKARASAFVMFLYLIPTTLLFHNFWTFQGAMRQDMTIHFLKNLAIMGGLLMVSAYGPGRLSLDGGKSQES